MQMDGVEQSVDDAVVGTDDVIQDDFIENVEGLVM